MLLTRRCGRRSEKTYSAPLATRLYAKEQIETPDGKQVRDYPRLRHGGAHLEDESGSRRDARVGRGHRSGGAAACCGRCLLRLANARRAAIRTCRGALHGSRLRAILALAGPIASLAPHYHVLGTDKVGQDVLYQALKTIRTSLVIGTLTTLVLLPLGIALGIMAGYFRGWIDDVIQYLYTTLNSIPGVLLIAAAVLMMQVLIDRTPSWFRPPRSAPTSGCSCCA